MKCNDGVVTSRFNAIASGCKAHCQSSWSSTLESLGHPLIKVGYDMTTWNDSTVSLNTTDINGQTNYYMAHGKTIQVPCTSDMGHVYGQVSVSCRNQLITIQPQHTCRYHCLAATIEAGGSYALQMPHPKLDDNAKVNISCPTDFWSGQVELQCSNGQVSRLNNTQCYRHCDAMYVSSNGLNIL